jgi:hypothetical protein
MGYADVLEYTDPNFSLIYIRKQTFIKYNSKPSDSKERTISFDSLCQQGMIGAQNDVCLGKLLGVCFSSSSVIDKDHQSPINMPIHNQYTH